MRPLPVVLTREQVCAALVQFAAQNATVSEVESDEPPMQFGMRVSAEIFRIAGEQIERRLTDPEPENLPRHDPRFKPVPWWRRMIEG